MAIPIPITWRGHAFIVVLKLTAVLIGLGFGVQIADLFFNGSATAIWIFYIIDTIIVVKYIFPILDGLSAFLYIRIKLRTPISFHEANKIRYFFVPNRPGKWLPLTFIRKLPVELRRQALFTSINKAREEFSRNE